MGLDLKHQNIAAPAIRDSLFGIPDALLGVLHRLEKPDVVAPRQFCNKLLQIAWSGQASAKAFM